MKFVETYKEKKGRIYFTSHGGLFDTDSDGESNFGICIKLSLLFTFIIGVISLMIIGHFNSTLWWIVGGTFTGLFLFFTILCCTDSYTKTVEDVDVEKLITSKKHKVAVVETNNRFWAYAHYKKDLYVKYQKKSWKSSVEVQEAIAQMREVAPDSHHLIGVIN